MESPVADALKAAAGVAIYQAADRTHIIHLLLGLLIYSQRSQALLQSRNGSCKSFEKWNQKLREPLLMLDECTPGQTPELQGLLTRFIAEGRAKGLLTESNLALHLMRDPDPRIDKFLKAFKTDRQDFIALFSESVTADQDPETPKRTAFGDFIENLNEKAKRGEIVHIQGRQDDMRWLVNTLCQHRRKSAILIGNPGVGKTALIEELALQILEGTVPDELKGKVIYSLDVGGMVAGTKLRGELEERMKNLVRFLRQDKTAILFVDEMHTIMSAGNARGSSLNPSNMLKPALSRGEIVCIGATTPDDVGPLEQDPAFKRRFQFRWLKALTDEETLVVLKAEAKRLEKHYGITYTIGGIKRILEAANDYYPHQFNPDRAITLADAVGSHTKNMQEQTVVNTKAVNASLRASNIKSTVQVVEAVTAKMKKVLGPTKHSAEIAYSVSGYMLHLHQPGILILDTNAEWVSREIANILAKEFHGEEPLVLDGEELAGNDALLQLKGAPSVLYKEPTLLDVLRYSPHRVVYVRCFEKSLPEFQQAFSRALLAGELAESNGRKLRLQHAYFVIQCESINRDIGFGPTAATSSKPRIASELLKRSITVCLPDPNPAWVEEYLMAKMLKMADRVKTKLKVAFSAEMPAYIRQQMFETSENEAMKLVEGAILRASQQQIKRLVITPETFENTDPV
jgi:ATP-dependent Clp protease ATP-binding subunit ClpA